MRAMKRKKMLAYLRNCSNRNLGRKVRKLYLAVLQGQQNHLIIIMPLWTYTHTAAWFYCTLFTPIQQHGFTVLCLHPHSSMVLLYCLHPYNNRVLLYSVYTHTTAWFYCTLSTPIPQCGFTVLCLHPRNSMVLLYSVYTHTAVWYYCTLFTPTQQHGFTVLCLHPHSSVVLLYSVYTHTPVWFYCTLFTPTQQHGFTVLCLQFLFSRLWPNLPHGGGILMSLSCWSATIIKTQPLVS